MSDETGEISDDTEMMTSEEFAQFMLNCGVDTSCCYDLADLKSTLKGAISQLRDEVSDLRGFATLSQEAARTILGLT